MQSISARRKSKRTRKMTCIWSLMSLMVSGSAMMTRRPGDRVGKGQRRHHGGWGHHCGWASQRKPRWAQNNWRQKKGMGQGKRDEWGGEYAEGGYRDVAGNFFPCLGMSTYYRSFSNVCHIVHQPCTFLSFCSTSRLLEALYRCFSCLPYCSTSLVLKAL